MRIIVCTNAINEWYRKVVKYSLINMEKYCHRHGYQFILNKESDFSEIQTRDPPWYKILAMKNILDQFKDSENCDYIVWIDPDTQILKPEVKLERFIDLYMEGFDVLVGKEFRS